MRFSTTVFAGLAVAASVYAQEDQGTSGTMTTLAIVETTDTVILATTETSVVATSTEVVGTTTTETSAPIVSGTQSASPAEVSRAACLEECPVDDNDCRAECASIPNAVNPIADCQAKCYKGNGTDADNLAYKGCYQGCIETATTSFAAVTTSTVSAGEATETAEVTSTADGSEDAASTASRVASSAASGASASATAATGAGSNLKATFSAAGILGLAAFVLVL